MLMQLGQLLVLQNFSSCSFFANFEKQTLTLFCLRVWGGIYIILIHPVYIRKMKVLYFLKHKKHLKDVNKTSLINFGRGCSASRCRQESQSSQDQRNWKLLRWYANHQTKRSKTATAMLSILRNKISVAWAST